MIPLAFLAAVLAVTFGAFVGHRVWRHGISEQFRRLAAEHHMHYAPRDLFQITPRVIEGFAVPGASDLRVMDVVYQREPDRYRYLFTIEYTQGVVRTQRRIRRAATFCEPRDQACPVPWSTLELAPAELCLADQYAHLCRGCDRGDEEGRRNRQAAAAGHLES
jgi:hypothetical protein